MPTLSVTPGDPRNPAATALLRASHALMENLFPAEANHYLSLDALCTPDIRFFTGQLDGETKGCGALALRGDYAEVKSMYLAEEARGTGLAAAILQRLEDEARALDLPVLRLETGTRLHAAHKLYARHGFTPRGPFGDYPDGPHNLFLEKTL